MTGRRAATVRLAWRLARASRGRSILIALLVAIPAMAGAFAAVTIRTAHLSADEAASRQLGRADAIVVVPGGPKPLTGDIDVGRGGSRDETISNIPQVNGNWNRTDWQRSLPAGSRITPDAWVRTMLISVGNVAENAQAVALDLNDPMTRGIYRLRSGSAPSGSGEVALTRSLADRLDAHVGTSVELGGSRPRVVAIVENPNALDEQSIVATAAALGGLGGHRGSDSTAPVTGDWYGNTGYWLVDTPSAAPDLHNQLLHDGVVYETRDQWEHPAPYLASTSQVDGQVLIVLGTVAGFGLLEVLLLAGAAFAVGTRRQTRELGLLAATGGDDTDIRRTVLAQGALLGVAGALVGLAAGVLAVELFRGTLEHIGNKRFGALDAAPSDLTAVAILGVIAGLVAAIVPARAAAARPVLSMLRERYGSDGRLARLPRWSVLAIVAGAVLTVVASFRWHAAAGGLSNTFVSTGSVSAVVHGLGTMLRENSWPAVLWLGSVLMLAGLVRACPAIVSRLSMLSHPLPLSPRLALRDAGRQRHRTAPAIAAVMTVVAGAVLVLFVASSSDLRDKNQFQPAVPVGLINVEPGNPRVTAQSLDEAATRTAALVGGGTRQVIDEANAYRGASLVVRAPGCVGAATEDLLACQYHSVGIATADTIDLIAGRDEPAARQALDNGGAVVLEPSLVAAETVDVRSLGAPRHSQNVQLPATVVRGLPTYGAVPQVYVSAATAAAHGWSSRSLTALVKPAHTPSTAVMDRAQRQLGSDVVIVLQRSYHSRYSSVLIAMLGAAAIATLAGTSIAVALALAESRADMATMAAVGASPSRRRIYAMGQASIVAGLGTTLGVALGAFVGIATLAGSSIYPTSTPFTWLAGVLVIAPGLAIAVAGLTTRSRLTLTRRMA